MPRLLLPAHTTWQKLPATIIIIIVTEVMINMAATTIIIIIIIIIMAATISIIMQIEMVKPVFGEQIAES